MTRDALTAVALDTNILRREPDAANMIGGIVDGEYAAMIKIFEGDRVYNSSCQHKLHVLDESIADNRKDSN